MSPLAQHCPLQQAESLQGFWQGGGGDTFSHLGAKSPVSLPSFPQGCVAGDSVEHPGLHGGEELALDEAVLQNQASAQERRDREGDAGNASWITAEIYPELLRVKQTNKKSRAATLSPSKNIWKVIECPRLSLICSQGFIAGSLCTPQIYEHLAQQCN